MKYKVATFLICLIISIGYINKINKIEIVDDSKYAKVKENTNDKIKDKKEKTKKIKDKKEKNKSNELEYWSNVTGETVVKVTKINAKLSFYTDLDCENYEGCNGITASGVKLYDGVVANNMYKMGTTVYFKGYGEYKILDRGGKGLSTYYNFDMYIPRNYGESDKTYHSRVNNMGIRKTTGYILEFAE